jgi:hypothetical protein
MSPNTDARPDAAAGAVADRHGALLSVLTDLPAALSLRAAVVGFLPRAPVETAGGRRRQRPRRSAPSRHRG